MRVYKSVNSLGIKASVQATRLGFKFEVSRRINSRFSLLSSNFPHKSSMSSSERLLFRPSSVCLISSAPFLLGFVTVDECDSAGLGFPTFVLFFLHLLNYHRSRSFLVFRWHSLIRCSLRLQLPLRLH